MTFEREKRLLLGWLALFVPIPLPFNQVLEWPLLFLYCVVVIYFLQRVEAGHHVVLPTWSLNLLGLIYLPLFFLDIRLTFIRNSPVKALLHLILFLLVVKLYSLRRESEKWHLMVAIFFVFIGAMATSSHVTIGLYLLAFLVASLFALARLAQLHVLARFEKSHKNQGPQTTALPFRGPLAAGTVLVILVTIPLFAIMPRFREPFVGAGSGLPGISRTTGFSDSVDLRLTSSIRGNRNVVARIQYEKTIENPDELRFKGAAFDIYRNRRWFRLTHQSLRLQTSEDQRFHLVNQADLDSLGSLSSADMYLEPIGNNSLILPSEAVGLEIDFFPMVELDLGGAVMLPIQSRRDTLRYKVHLTSQPNIAARRSPDPNSELAALDIKELKPSIVDLAAQVMGEGTPEEKVDRLERHLVSQYTYTTDLLGRDGENPLEDFLFVHKSGQCELFATSMVLMLRSQGIPARFVTGLLSAEFNPLEDYFILRQQNAHAWVEAFTPERGWKVYDPTPPEGRPAVAARGFRLILTQIVDFITFRWDRYVLTYGADDQKSFFQDVREYFTTKWEDLKVYFREDKEGGVQGFNSREDLAPQDTVWRPQTSQLVVLFLFLAGVVASLLWRHRRRWSGEAAYLRLRTALQDTGLEVLDTTAPRQLEAQAKARFPEVSEPLGRLMDLYLLESFAARNLSAQELQELREAWGKIRASLRAALKKQKRWNSRQITAPTG